ncbi:MAG TPA: TetR/AcrR family transcriptional regulator [Caldilineaceae bacterium]|nr:TetR/AcrR family transcriptional regulator [Caldilineaceae bacterium]
MAKETKFQRQLTEARRAQILEAAIAVIAEQGFQRTTIKQIAAQAEVADGTIYNYFKNKDDILMAIIAQITEAETRELHFAEAQGMNFADFTQEYVAHRMTEINEGYPVLKVLITETLANPDLARQIYDQVYAPSFTVAERYMQQLFAAGALPDVDVAIASRLFAAPLLGLLLLRMLGDEHVAQEWNAYGEVMAQWMARMVSHPQPGVTEQNEIEGDLPEKKSKKRKKKKS